MPPIICKEKCKKCTLCAQICPLDVFAVEKSGDVVVKYPDECWHCRACAEECPAKAITMRYPLSHMMFHMPVPGKGDSK